ncbi:TIGR03643 family protein [Microscilla marina]|uniref:TIGR03643 family protein n=1 Tax=Microscilla marina ATCC 23134 TaxID=313606 RepID=A1ZJQ0_MICM2|nr:TIGR03643 family protein [Microscilla marina]EAY29353.1 conserved hypothetical protein [Microscilla marina ATCC 23134]
MNTLKQKLKNLDNESIDRIIEMAWEDRTPFEAIWQQFELTEQEVIRLMRKEMKSRSWKMWRKRVQGRKTKHKQLRAPDVNRFHCSRQKSISQNKIAKRNH